MAATRHARLKAFAKLNLDLKIFNRGEDGFHELRSVFQTVSIFDTLDIAFTPSRKTELTLEETVFPAVEYLQVEVQFGECFQPGMTGSGHGA